MLVVAPALQAQSVPGSASMAPAGQVTLRVASELDFPPMALVNPDGSADGFSVELFKAVAATMGLQYRIYVGPWAEIRDDVLEGKADLLINMAINPARALGHDFSVPHTVTKAAVFVREGGAALRTLEDLRGKSLLVVDGDHVHQWAEAQPWATRLHPVQTVDVAMRSLARGEHDAVLVAGIAGLLALKSAGLGNVAMLELPLPGAEQKFAFAVRKGQTELLAQLNEGLALVRADGRYAVLYDKWFHEVEPRGIPLRDVLLSTVPVLVFLLGLLGIVSWRLWRATILLRAQRDGLGAEVDVRTRLLRETEARHAAAISSAMDAIVIHDQQGRILEVNPAAEHLFGFREASLVGADIGKLCIPQDGQGFPAGRLETTALRADGHALEIELTRVSSTVGDQTITTAFARDIGAFKQTLRSLQQSEEAYRVLFDGAKDAQMTVEPPSWNFAACNQAALQMFGVHDKTQFLALNVSDLSPATQPNGRSSAEMAEELIATAMREGSHFFTWTHKRLCGADFPAEVQLSRVAIGGMPRIHARVRDVTVETRAAQALYDLTKRFELIVETIDDVFWMSGVAAQKTFYVSPAYETIWQRSCASLYENPGSFLDSVHPQDRVRASETVRRQELGLPFEHEYRIVRPDGSIRVIWDRGFPVADESGRVTRFVGVAKDVTEIRSVRAALELSEQKFRNLVAEIRDGIFVADNCGTLTFANAALARSLGFANADQLIGKKAMDFVAPDDAADVVQLIDALPDGAFDIAEVVVRIVRSDGAQRIVEVSAVGEKKDGVVVSLRGVARDITRRRRAEEAAQAAMRARTDFMNNVTHELRTTNSAQRHLGFRRSAQGQSRRSTQRPTTGICR